MGNQLRPSIPLSLKGHKSSHLAKDITRRFSETELRLIKATFKDLSLRSTGESIDKATFLHHFPLPGLHGEQLFDIFDDKHSGSIDFEEFISGIALCTKGAFEEKLDLVFRICDITKDGSISAEELTTMLHQVPAKALREWQASEALEAGVKAVSELEAAESGKEKSTPKVTSVDGGLRIDTSLHDYDVESKDNTSQAEDLNAANCVLIEGIVADAFKTFDLKLSDKLSKKQFTEWVSCNARVAKLFNSVFSSCRSPSTSAPPSDIKTKIRKLPRSFSSSTPRNVNPDIFQSRRKANSVGAKALDLLSPQHKLTKCSKEGVLYKLGQRTKRLISRYCRLCDDVIYYYNKECDSLPSGVISVGGCFVEKLNQEKLFGIQIITAFDSAGSKVTRSRTLYTKTEDERDEWLKTLKVASRVKVFKNEYDLKEKIGSGKFSDVFLGISKRSGAKHAIKVVEKAHLSAEEKEFLRTEVAILRLVNHPSIVQLVDLIETQTRTYIVMELLEGGELFDYIAGRSRFTEMEAYFMIRQLVLGIKYLHSAGIAHRDLKPENVLLARKMKPGESLTGEFQVKLSDFGLSKMVAPQQILKLPCGTVSYVAPEILQETGYGIEADMWSLGIIMYLVVRGKLPFDDDDKDVVIDDIMNKEIDWDTDAFWQKRSPQLLEVLKGLLTKDHKKRMTAQQVMDHSWLKLMAAAAEEENQTPL